MNCRFLILGSPYLNGLSHVFSRYITISLHLGTWAPGHFELLPLWGRLVSSGYLWLPPRVISSPEKEALGHQSHFIPSIFISSPRLSIPLIIARTREVTSLSPGSARLVEHRPSTSRIQLQLSKKLFANLRHLSHRMDLRPGTRDMGLFLAPNDRLN